MKTLNALSKEILSGLNSETVSLESVEKKMAERKAIIQSLINISPSQRRGEMTESEEEIAKTLFSTFETLSNDINTALKDALNESRETLATAAKKRKADDKYRVISQPDITHF